MTSRDLVVRALNHEAIDRVPRDFRASARLEALREDELEEMRFRYASDIEPAAFEYPRGRRAKGAPGKAGRYTDAWGCTWQLTDRGTQRQLVDYPLADPAAIAAYRPPVELLDKLRPNRVAEASAPGSRFILADTQTQPLRRLGQLRGPQAAVAELNRGTRRARDLLAMLHDFSCQEMERWAATEVDGVAFADDFITSAGLAVKSGAWHDLLKPLYRQYCQILHDGDKFAFLRCSAESDLDAILDDLVEIGVDAIDCPLSVLDLEAVADQARGRVALWTQACPDHILSQGTIEQCAGAVSQIREALDFGLGGLIAKCRWDVDTPFRNMVAVLQQWSQPVPACF